MNKVYQVKTGDEDGDCFPACLASLLEVPLDTVPDFAGKFKETWFQECNRWLEQHKLQYVEIWINNEKKPDYKMPDFTVNTIKVLCIVTGWNGCDNKGTRHCVITRPYAKDNQTHAALVHDPNPKGAGLISVERIGFLVPLMESPE